MIKEVWKSIKGYEGLYLVSNLGNFKRLEKRTKDSRGVYRTFKEKVLSNKGFDKDGYVNRPLRKNMKCTTKKAHRLVALAFIPNPDKFPDVNHINGIKNDNRVENLEWVTKKRNSQHALDTNLTGHGELSNLAKLTNLQMIEVYKSSEKATEISKKYGICITQVYNIKRGITGRRVTGHKI